MIEQLTVVLGVYPWPVLCLVLFLLMASNGALSTPPSELTLGVAGYLAATHDLPLPAAIVAAFLGNLVGALTLFTLARRWGRTAIVRLLRFTPFSSETVLLRTERLFSAHGELIVCAVRCVPNLRSVISIPAALARMPTGRFLAYSSVGILLWTLAWTLAGYFLGPALSRSIDSLGFPGLVLAGVCLVVFSFWLHRNSRN
jgi:membrane protein DedA with SNARE-associated domain